MIIWDTKTIFYPLVLLTEIRVTLTLIRQDSVSGCCSYETGGNLCSFMEPHFLCSLVSGSFPLRWNLTRAELSSILHVHRDPRFSGERWWVSPICFTAGSLVGVGEDWADTWQLGSDAGKEDFTVFFGSVLHEQFDCPLVSRCHVEKCDFSFLLFEISTVERLCPTMSIYFYMGFSMNS